VGNLKKISLIIPLYNVEKYVFRAAESIKSQAFDGLEIVLVDDGSTDKSLETCESLLAGLDVKSVRQKNAGPGGARNTGILNATGEYIMFLDSDDFLMPNAFSSILSLLENESPDVLFGRYHLWTKHKGLIHAKQVDPCSTNELKGRIEYILCSQPEATWCPVRYICRCKHLLEHSVFFETNVLCEDVKWTIDLLMAIENNNGKISFLAEPFYVYFHRRPGSTMTTTSVKRLLDLNNIVSELLEVFKERHSLYRVLVFEHFFYINEYCLFGRSDRKQIFESYQKLLPKYHHSGSFPLRVAGRMQNRFLFFILSLGLYSVKMLRRALLYVKWAIKGRPRVEVPTYNSLLIEVVETESPIVGTKTSNVV